SAAAWTIASRPRAARRIDAGSVMSPWATSAPAGRVVHRRGSRANPRTSWPRAASPSANRPPRNPVTPVTRTFIGIPGTSRPRLSSHAQPLNVPRERVAPRGEATAEERLEPGGAEDGIRGTRERVRGGGPWLHDHAVGEEAGGDGRAGELEAAAR